MAGTKVIDADGHIIERTDELRKYLKSPFNKRGGPLTASEPWDRDSRKPCRTNQTIFPRAPRRRGLAAHHGSTTTSSRRFCIRRRSGNVSRIREPDYAVALCEAYNDYVHDHYAKVSDRLKPIAVHPAARSRTGGGGIAPGGDANSAIAPRWCARPDCACRWGISSTIRFIVKRKVWVAPSRCMAPTAPKSLLRGRSRLSLKFTRYLFRWVSSCSFPT